MTCSVVEATEEEEMSEAMQNLEVQQQQHPREFQYIVVHVYVVVNNKQADPRGNPYTSWNITGISLRSTRTFVT